MNGVFEQHLCEAIVTNCGRAGDYAARSHGRSGWLSAVLVAMEILTILPAKFFDWKARSFQERGVGVVANDFVPLHGHIKDSTCPPKYQNKASKAAVLEVKRTLRTYGAALKQAVRNRDFAEAAEVSYLALKQIHQLEEDSQSHFAMTAHLVESIGLATLNAMKFEQMGEADAAGLSRNLIRFEAASLPYATWFDRQAQACHAKGVGILVNDVPAIPFEQEFLKQVNSFALPIESTPIS